ncbi:MAG: TetR/AcrR family transcriptional regulator [Acidimicrobiia bacterium]|nr:TetR/AcrR family transcriptional regulator [Acidimicrobiia bacterium]
MFESSETVTTDRRQLRRESTRSEILDEAWALCRDVGLAGLSMRELAKRVGLRAPSLYSYFDSKDAIYDAMFRQGYEQLRDHMGDYMGPQPVTRERLKEGVRHYVEFCVADTTRYQLLFQRTIPGFEPSAESYAVAVLALEDSSRALSAAGIEGDAALDMWTGLLSGLTAQQISNDPGGERWIRLLDDAIDMFLDHYGALPRKKGSRK